MKFFTWLKLLLISNIRDDKILFELKKKIDTLKLENKDLKTEIMKLKSNYNLKFQFYDRDLESKIIENLSDAKSEICIAVAWLTSDNLIKKLQELKDKGINIKILVTKDKFNIYKQGKLVNASNSFKIVNIPKGTSKYKNDMHNKYCVIDNKKVVDGSYNWSNHAKYNEEHIIIVESELIAKMYKENFYRIYNDKNYYTYSITKVS